MNHESDETEFVLSGKELLKTMIDDWTGSDVDLYTFFKDISPETILPNRIYRTDAQLSFVDLID